MPRPTPYMALAALLLLACRPENDKPTTTGTTSESLTTSVGGFSSTGSPTTTGVPTTNGAPTTTDASSSLDIDDTGASDSSGSNTPSGFIIPPESEPLVCDCPAGQMCVRSMGIDSWFIVCAVPPAGCDPADVCTPACAAACALPPPQPKNCDGREPPTEWLECGGEAAYECSTWAGNCPAGEKCVVVPDWTPMHCQPIDAAPAAIGEPCTGPSNDDPAVPDTCVAGAGCWGVDPVTRQRVCAAHCTGTPADPGCPPDTACQVDPDTLIAICVAT